MLDGLGCVHGSAFIPGGSRRRSWLEKQKLAEGKDLIKYFCQPCAPTKSNGLRTRNLPKHAPDKWLTFKKYNIRDVETEMSIQARLLKYPVPDSVWEEYRLDQEITTAAWVWIWSWCGKPFRWTALPLGADPGDEGTDLTG